MNKPFRGDSPLNLKKGFDNMDCIKIKIDSFDKLVSLIKSTYDNFLYRAYNEHLKQ